VAVVFVAGGTGYMGQELIPRLVGRGHEVRALARSGSEARLPPGCRAVAGNALEAGNWRKDVEGADTWVHLVGTPKPAPWKGPQFRAVDLASVRVAVEAARSARVRHFVYLSVGQPAPVMKAYVVVRAEGEALIRAAGLNATFLRPWYVLGPGHWWPLALKPLYVLAEAWPGTRDTASRLGLVTLAQMTAALVQAVERPAEGVKIVEVPAIIRAPGTT
jgi:uncharacterized protein YbjT (DUF2867 family)